MIDYDKIRQIHDNTMRAVPNAGIVPDNSTFKYLSNGRLVKKGTPYHIHYTFDFEEYYMTGAKHGPTSRIIELIKPEDKSNFSKYSTNFGKTYEKMADVFIKEGPEGADYVKGYFNRHFVIRRNDPSEGIKEVDADFHSPLYEKFTIEWRLTGKLRNVFIENRRTVYSEDFKHPGIGKMLSNYIEYFILPEASELNKQRKALGILDIPKDAKGNIVVPAPAQSIPLKEKNNELIPRKKKKKRGSAMTGPPAGVMTGGAGGGGAY